MDELSDTEVNYHLAILEHEIVTMTTVRDIDREDVCRS